MRISDWSSDVCSSDLQDVAGSGVDRQRLDILRTIGVTETDRPWWRCADGARQRLRQQQHLNLRTQRKIVAGIGNRQIRGSAPPKAGNVFPVTRLCAANLDTQIGTTSYRERGCQKV